MRFPFNTGFLAFLFLASCTTKSSDKMEKIKLITLDPGHFHAGLVQKSMYPGVDSLVYVYAPEGEDLILHLERIDQYNSRSLDPTGWKEEIYVGPDYLEKMIAQKPGNVVVLAGNNKNKARYITESLKAGLNVLSDKPVIIHPKEFDDLVMATGLAKQNGLLLYDIMTERYEITSEIQRELFSTPEIFGQPIQGTEGEPGVVKESTHHFYKEVSGKPLKRPGWFMDVGQQGEGLVDVTTHLVDLVQWTCFPDQIIDFNQDIQILGAKRWATPITGSQFEKVTGLKSFPEFLESIKSNDSTIDVRSNGSITWRIKGLVARVKVEWNFQAPAGGGDTHYSRMRGTKSDLVIRQGADQGFKPSLFIELAPGSNDLDEKTLNTAFKRIASKYPGVELKPIAQGWEVVIPDQYREGHESHFARVMEKFTQYLLKGGLPEWETPNMLAKYFTTTRALEWIQKTEP